MLTDEDARKSALIRFYFKRNPDKMSDSTFAKSWAEIDYVLKYTGIIEAK